jgi:ADP-dependent NAD(P)H-hydrate dehydratase / NAD(P)H-hydrate epimerase
MESMHVLSAAEMQACDRATAERFGVPTIDLMRAASAAVADVAQREFPAARRITVLCGKGNNGGDGSMAARLLAEAGLAVTVLLFGSPEALKGDAAIAWRELAESNAARIHVVADAAELDGLKDAQATDLIVDAMLGTGFTPPLKGMALAALEWIKAGAGTVPVLSVDLPSGWPADETSASLDLPIFPSDAVVTFTAPKPAHVFGQLTRRWDQPVVVAPIGSPDGAVASELGIEWAGAAMELAAKPRAADTNKGRLGHVLVVGGTFGAAGGKAGAPAMTALAALRAGAGLVTAAVPVPAMSAVGAIAPELMTWGLEATADGAISSESLAQDRLEPLVAGKSVLAIGPGLGQAPETVKFTIELLTATRMPAVIDADGLNILAARPALLGQLAQGRTLVLTPHPGEMARLTGMKTAEVQADRLAVALGFARRMGVTLVLKGARTIIAHPDGRAAINTSGNPGMAKGGSGDLLTGFIAGMLAQHPDDPARAVEAAVYLHGLAADIAVREGDEHTLLATDSLKHLAHAFRAGAANFRGAGANGYVWIQGLPRAVTSTAGRDTR